MEAAVSLNFTESKSWIDIDLWPHDHGCLKTTHYMYTITFQGWQAAAAAVTTPSCAVLQVKLQPSLADAWVCLGAMHSQAGQLVSLNAAAAAVAAGLITRAPAGLAAAATLMVLAP
jgi:hypothetical protein